MSLKDRTASGLIWSFADNIVRTGLGLIIGIILARLISPEEFGIIGITSILTSIFPMFAEGGFGSALIQKKDCTENDYSSVFFYNIITSLGVYLILFYLAPFFGNYFEIDILPLVIKILSINIILNSFGAVQAIILTKKLNFKLLAKISFTSQISGGVLAIFLAYKGYGIWSLIVRNLFQTAVNVVLMFLLNNWRPKKRFDLSALKKLFRFGSNLLIGGLLHQIFENAYYFVIGKFYSPIQLGYYSRADMFKNLPSQNLTGVIQRVSFPVLSALQDDNEKLKIAFRKLIKSTIFLSSILMFGMGASSKSLILFLLGSKWTPSIIYLQLLSVAGFLYPLHALNLNIMNVKGRSDLFLKLEIFKKVLLIPVVWIGVTSGIEMMIFGMIVFSFIVYFLNAGTGGGLINYSIIEQMLDILPSIIIALFVSLIMFITGYIFQYWSELPILLSQIFAGLVTVMVLSEKMKFEPYTDIKNIVWTRILVPIKTYFK